MARLLKFSKPNCTPCAMVTNYLKDKNVSYEEVNPLEDVITGAKFAISSVPVLIVLNDNNEEVYRSVGFNPPEIDKAISML